METLVLPNVYGIVRLAGSNSTRILLQRRWKPSSDPVNTGRWELPGGKWRAWETAQACLVREVREETGVEVVDVDTGADTLHLREQMVEATVPFSIIQMVTGPYPSVLVVFECVGRGEPLSRGDGSRDAQWMSYDRVTELVDAAPDECTPLSLLALKRWIAAPELRADW